MSVGLREGEVCNRNGCKGIMELYDPVEDLSCSCHINPPCTKCTTPKMLECPECGWADEYYYESDYTDGCNETNDAPTQTIEQYTVHFIWHFDNMPQSEHTEEMQMEGTPDEITQKVTQKYPNVSNIKFIEDGTNNATCGLCDTCVYQNLLDDICLYDDGMDLAPGEYVGDCDYYKER